MSDWRGTQGDHWAINADRYTRMLAGYGEILTEAAAFRTGETVLDVGCGCGDISLAAGRAVDSSGAVLGVDLSPAMLGVATARAADAGLDHVEFVASDAATYSTDRAGFDAVVSRFGVMFFDDPSAAFANIRSLMATGARLAFVCWQDLFVNDWMIVPATAAAEVLPLPVGNDPTAPGAFAFSDADRVTGILAAAGFAGPRAAPVAAKVWLGDTAIEAAARLRTSGLGRAMFADADPALVDEAIARAVASLVPYESPSGVELDSAAWLVTASA
jgi:SAM-dependent methyltransferase